MKFKALILPLALLSFALSQPITGEAEKLIFKKDRIIYRGKVKLTRGDSLLRADEVIVFLDDRGKPVKMVAKGEVRYSEPGRKAFSDYAEYDFRTDVIVLRGRARVEEEKNVLEAEEIVYDKKNQTLQAKGEKSKVRTIYIEEENE